MRKTVKLRMLLIVAALALLAGCTEDNSPRDGLMKTFGTTIPPHFAGISTISNVTATTLQAEWSAADDDVTPATEITYNLYVSNTSGGQDFSEPPYTTSGTTFLAMKGLSPATKYCIVVRAEDGNGNEDGNTEEQCATTATLSTVPVFGGITAIGNVAQTSLQAEWAPATDDATPASLITYNVYAGDAAGAEDFDTPVASTTGSTFVALTGLSGGTEICLVVRAEDEDGNEDGNTEELCATTAVVGAVPVFEGITAITDVTETSLQAEWAPATDEATPASQILYHVYLSGTAGGQDFDSPLASTTGATFIVLTGLSEGAQVCLVVRAEDEDGNEDSNTEELCATTATIADGPTFAGVTAISNLAETGFQVEWAPASDAETAGAMLVYNIYLATSPGGQDFGAPTATTTGSTFIQLSGLTGGTEYCVVVRAEDEDGNEDGNSEEICATTPSDTAAPDFAGIEAVAVVKATSFTASWQPADDETTPGSQIRYHVYSAATSGGQNFSTPTASTTGATFKGFAGLTPGTQYCLVVRAEDGLGHEDTNTEEICTTTLQDNDAPSFGGATSATLSQLAPPEVTLGWSLAFDDNSAQADISYRIFRAEVLGTEDFVSPLATVTGANSYLDTSVASNTTYYYVVRAMDELGNEDGNTTEVAVSTPYDSAGITYAYHPGLHDLGHAGAALALLDWNGDGYLDLAVGTYYTGNPQSTGTAAYRGGQVSIYPGRSDGLFERDPSVQFYSPNSAANGYFGRGLATCDVTGDGAADDLVVGASGERRVYLYLNTGAGQDTTPDRVIGTPSGQGDTDNFGESVACGNINGSGGDDLVVAAPYSDDNGAANSGTLYFYNNNSSPPVIDLAGPNASYYIYPQNDFVAQIPDNNQPYCGLGLALADLDGDGQLDLAVGCPGADTGSSNDGVIVFYTRPDLTDSDTWVVASYAVAPNNDDYWGWSLAAGNVDDSDTGLELVVGQRYYDSPGVNAGALFIYDVSYTPTAFSLSAPLGLITDRGANGAYAGFGGALTTGYLPGDSVADLVVGAVDEDMGFISGNTAADIGAVYVFHGNANAVLDAAPEQTNINTYEQTDGTPVYGGAYDVRFGQAVCTGDIDNDGKADLLVGAENDPSDGKEASARGTGRVYVWYSVATGEMDLAGPPDDYFTAPGFAPGKRFGSSCVVMDYNGDGRNDVVIGAQYADDVTTDQGAVYIYLGVASTSTGGSDTGSVPVDGSPEVTLFIPEAPGTAYHYFGSSLASCDLTGDSYPELIVGARQFDGAVTVGMGTARGNTNEGAVFIFAGSDAGVTPESYQAIFPTATDVGVSSYGQGGYSDNNFGYAVGCYPAVNGTGGLDLVVGAPFAAKPGGNGNQGMVAIFYGAVNEDPTTGGASCQTGVNEYVGTLCLIDDTRDIRIDDQGPYASDDALFGSAIAVGDWDGANGQDLVIGAYRARELSPAPDNNGGVYAFLGVSAGGFIALSGGVPLSTFSHLDPTGYISNGFADSALALEDLNNNGVPELIIGVNYCTYDNASKKRRGTATGCVYVNRGDYRP